MATSQDLAETVLFAVDLHPEVGQHDGRNWSRLDVIKHAISNVVHAKAWSCAAHRYGLIKVQEDSCVMEPVEVASNADRFLEALHSLQPMPALAASQGDPEEQQQRPFDVGSLIAAVQPYQHSARATAAQQPVCGGVLGPVGTGQWGGPDSSRRSHKYAPLRVVLVYCRSQLPAPVWHQHLDGGLAIDCLHVHHKPQPGESQQQLQEVYSSLEALVDKMAVRVGHASLIYESTAKNLGKLLSCMAAMVSHPLQRPSQAAAKPPVDLASADLQLLPSDAANMASGVPIMTPQQLPTVATGAWAKPLGSGPQAAAEYRVQDGATMHARAAAAPEAYELRDIRHAGDTEGGVVPEGAVVDSTATAAAISTCSGEGKAHGQLSRMLDQHTLGMADTSSAHHVALGVPVECVQGVPECRPTVTKAGMPDPSD